MTPEPLHRTKRAIYVVLLVIAIAASSFAIYNQFSSDSTSSSLADQVAKVCATNRVYAEAQGLNCQQADAVKQNNAPAPLQGPKGDVGPKGQTGDTGPTGIGLPGTNGSQGTPGEPGTPGSAGATGTDGKSVTGPQGPQGEQGVKGDTGDTGATGPQGPQGVKGDKGDTASLPSQIPFGPFPDGTYVICYLNDSGTAYGNCQPAPTAGVRK